MRLTFPNIEGNIDIYMQVLRAICGDTAGKSMIDLMCCTAPNTPKLGFSERWYVDIMDRILDHPDEQKFFHKHNALSVHRFMAYEVDVAICSDGIEHLTVEDGHKLLEVMNLIGHKQIIFTPLGELWLEKTPSNDPEAHRSAWYPEMIPGWASIVFPDYHKKWGVGAFFAWKCDDIEKDFERVKQLLHGLSQ